MAIRNKDRRYFFERFGIYNKNITQNSMWFHAASVGEVIAVLPLLKAIRTRHPEQTFLLTTGTPTGARIAQQYMPKNTSHIYLPIDLPGAVKRFLIHTKPKCAIIMETELWADLYYQCHRNNVPISIINARLSHRTLRTNAWMYRLYAETLSHVSKILARSEEDANGFMTIGATSSKIKVIGNIKLATIDISNIQTLKEIKRPYVLAASTHDNEEELIARAWIEKFDNKLLVIAPRHPNRSVQIEKSLKNITQNLAIRSKGEPIQDATQIYLADTLGELLSLMKGADIIFMGGSLVPKGGHNVIEPARFGKAIIFGEYMDNFSEEANLLLSEGGAMKANDIETLMNIIDHLSIDPEHKKTLEMNSRRIIHYGNDIMDKYLSAIEDPVQNFKPNHLNIPSQ
ncbi:MAG: 3-deoxy-D-manno-octulosonic acid transferase [Gammaproteobacteria bacterium]|nr:3-deoxy-D-manno-octulosonic acid transferase [Gammaproteobacteria bacterium]